MKRLKILAFLFVLFNNNRSSSLQPCFAQSLTWERAVTWELCEIFRKITIMSLSVLKYRKDDMESISFTLSDSMLPFDIITELEEFLGVKDCVMCLHAYVGNKFVCTLCHMKAVKKLLLDNKIVIADKVYTYELCERKFKWLRIKNSPRALKARDIDSVLRQYGKVLISEIEKNDEELNYFAIIDIFRPIPDRVLLKRQICEVRYF